MTPRKLQFGRPQNANRVALDEGSLQNGSNRSLAVTAIWESTSAPWHSKSASSD